jgi:uncharacterized protein
MVSELILTRLQAEFDAPPDSVRKITDLVEKGAPPQYISRFRREEVGDLGEDQIVAIGERLAFLNELQSRKASILEQAKQRGHATDELEQTLATTFDQDLLDDLYQSFRPRRRTAALQAEERGLSPLALAIHHRTLGDKAPLEAAQEYVSAERGVATPEAALEGAAAILAERYGTDPWVRAQVRQELSRGILVAEPLAPTKKGAQRYEDLFHVREPVGRISAPRMLALRHAERDGILKIELTLPEGREVELFFERFGAGVDPASPLGQFLTAVFKQAFAVHARPGCEADVRRRMKERADRETVRRFCRSLRSQLMAPPLGPKKAMGVRASRAVLWVAAVDEDGSVGPHTTLEVKDEETKAAAVAALAQLLEQVEPAGIAIPHGRRQELAQGVVLAAVDKLPPAKRPLVVPVDEAASSIYATSATGRKALAGSDVGLRVAVSLARRLQDPLHELMGMDVRGLGFGQALNEVHQGMLQRQFHATFAACLSKVGLDVNSATEEHLAIVPGLDKDLAHAIVEHRRTKGPFRTLAQLAEVQGMDAERFRHVAGFLRVIGGDQPLDATGIHPDEYPLAEQLAAREGKPISEMMGRDLSLLPIRDLLEGGVDKRRLLDVIHCLSAAGKDPRGTLQATTLNRTTALADLKPGMELQGRVAHLAEFGAFIDIGVGQDGLLHVSQIPRNRQEGEEMLSVGQVLSVFVQRVELEKKRISLSLHRPRHEQDRDAAGREGERHGPRRPGRGRPPGRERERGSERPFRRPRRDDREDDGRERRPYRDRGDDRPRAPRIITIESDKPQREVVGHKGEFKTLSGLRALLRKEPEPPAPAPEQAPPP